MRLVETFLLAAGASKAMYLRRRIQQMLPIMVTVAILIMAAAALMTALAISGIYVVYSMLLAQGISQLTAVGLTALGAVLLILVVLMLLKRNMMQLKCLGSTPMADATDAFLNGLLSK